jgi:hypothetical protein
LYFDDGHTHGEQLCNVIPTSLTTWKRTMTYSNKYLATSP